MISVDVLAIKLDAGYVSLIRTRNSTEKYVNKFCVRNKKICRSVIYCGRFSAEKIPALVSSVHVHKLLQNLLRKISVLGPAAP